MGACLSAPSGSGGTAAIDPAVKQGAAAPASAAAPAPSTQQPATALASKAALEPQPSLPRTRFSVDTLGAVQAMQQALTLVSPAPALGVIDAAELLVPRLDAALVTVYAFAPQGGGGGGGGGSNDIDGSDGGGGDSDGDSDSDGAVKTELAAVLVAASGMGSPVLEEVPVTTGGQWSPQRAAAAAAASAAEGRGAPVVYGRESDEDLPLD